MMTQFNLPLLRKAVEWAESEARKPEIDSEWHQGYYAISGHRLGRHCGTAYCIAGHVAYESGYYVGAYPYRHDREDAVGDSPSDVARNLLGITFDEAWAAENSKLGLFNAGNTIEDVRRIAEEIARRHGEEL